MDVSAALAEGHNLKPNYVLKLSNHNPFQSIYEYLKANR